MAMHVRTEGDKPVVSSAKFGNFANVVLSKPHIIIIFHLKTNRQKLEKHHVNGSQTRRLNNGLIFVYILINLQAAQCSYFSFFPKLPIFFYILSKHPIFPIF